MINKIDSVSSFIAPNDDDPYVSRTHIYTQLINKGERNDVYMLNRVTGGPIVVIFFKVENEISDTP